MNNNLPLGAEFDSSAPFNKEQVDFEPLIEKFINASINYNMVFDDMSYFIDLLRDSKHYETINEILLNYDE